MDSPLGCAAGNWLEVKESVACLETNASEAGDVADLVTLVVEFAAHLLVQTERCPDLQSARKKAQQCLNSGEPRRKWDQMLLAQGADLTAFNERLGREHTAPVVLEVKAPTAGSISRWDARVVGEIVRDLGGGRLTKDSVLDYDAGIQIVARNGSQTSKNSVLARIHAADRKKAEAAAARLTQACIISDQEPPSAALIAEVIQ
jgi:thymidine phosphorylase